MWDEAHAPDERSQGELKEWLRTALDAYYRDGARGRAFRPFGRYIGSQEDLAGDLHAVYRRRPAVECGRWRNAVRDLLAENGANPAWREATQTLIDLASLMPAPVVLEVLPGVLRNRPDPTDARLANWVVSAATALASSTPAALKCLQRIRTAPSFAVHHAGLVLTALCRVDPDHWIDHVVDLEPIMQRLEAEIGGDVEAMRGYAERILGAITLEGVSAGLSPFMGRLFQHHDRWTNWLFEAWLVGSGSLLGHDETYLWLRQDPSKRVRLANEVLHGDYVSIKCRRERQTLIAKWRLDSRARPQVVELADRLVA